MIPRIALQQVIGLAGYYPVVAITGPRQSGKTTLARAAFADKPYVSLEDPDIRAYALDDPRGFLAQFPDGAVFDEAQRVPELFSYLQSRVDDDRRTGLFILTGSQQFGLMESISQSLAGRVGLLHLLPFSFGELGPAAADSAADPTAARPVRRLEDWLWRGFYPPIHDRNIPPNRWFSDYLSTYVERDVRSLLQVRDLQVFHRFVLMCEARSGQLLNLSSLANDCGITHNTAHAWLGVLESSYLVLRLPPFFKNLGKRLIKTPKLYFLDVGFAAWLMGIRDAAAIQTSSSRGALFETWIVSEFVKRKRHQLCDEEIYFWRDSGGNEIDLLVARGEDILAAVECKSGLTIADDWMKPLKRFQALVGSCDASLIYGGDRAQSRSSVDIYGWQQIDQLLDHCFRERRPG
jgi:predicted AAA+ superfamily ATPase